MVLSKFHSLLTKKNFVECNRLESKNTKSYKPNKQHELMKSGLSKARFILKSLWGETLPNPWNDARLKKLKDIHKGKRAFIIANGPSLKTVDLDLLKSEITFASNKIYLAYDQTDWRPTYLCCTDDIVAQNNKDILIKHPGVKLFGHSVFKYFKGERSITFCNPPRTMDAAKNWDLVDGISTGHSVVFYQLELAFWMGIREVYVIGIDFSFDVKSKPTGEIAMGNQVIKAAGESNHFHPNYRPIGETWTMPKLDKLQAEFEFALIKYQEHGGNIVNVSRKTMLEAWPRETLENVLSRP